MHALLERFFTCADRLVAEHGGRVDKHVGDCVMAVFGAPIAHGNDAERAVRAALAIRDAMPTVAAEAGRPVTVHIGVAGGEVVASGTGSATHREYTITGDSVNLAARLTDAARPGEILVSDAVRRTLVERLDCEETGALAVKGFAEPVLAWRLRECPRRRPRPADRSSAAKASWASSEASSTRLRDRARPGRARAGRGRDRQDPSDRGVPDTAEKAGFACHVGLVLDFGAGTGRDAIRTLVRGLLGVDDLAGGAEATAAPRALAGGLVAEADAVFLNDLLDLPQPVELRALYDAMDNAARNRASARRGAAGRAGEPAAPRLLVVEDVHWADQLVLAHLAQLAVTVAASPPPGHDLPG